MAAKKYGQRADYGKPIDAFFAKQQPHLRPILEELRVLVETTVPDARATIKWGMPFYERQGQMMCALAGFKGHVNLILAGSPDAYDDPDGLLEGEAKGGRHLKLRALADLPKTQVKGWLHIAAGIAGGKASQGASPRAAKPRAAKKSAAKKSAAKKSAAKKSASTKSSAKKSSAKKSAAKKTSAKKSPTR